MSNSTFFYKKVLLSKCTVKVHIQSRTKVLWGCFFKKASNVVLIKPYYYCS